MIFSLLKILSEYEYQILFVSVLISFFSKIGIFVTLIKKKIRSSSPKNIYSLLTAILVAATITDFAWIFKLIKMLVYPNFDYRIVLFFIRFAWAFFIIQYQCASLFIENIVNKNLKISLEQKIFSAISAILVLFFLATSILHFNCDSPLKISYIEKSIQQFVSFYLFVPLMISSVFKTIFRTKKTNIPIILKKQFNILIGLLIIPHWLSEFIHLFPFAQWSETLITQSVTFTSLSTLLLTFAIFFCARKIMGLRFLNLHDHVDQTLKSPFMDDFKTILERLSAVTNLQELCHISTSFFKETFAIPLKRTHLYLRAIDVKKNKKTPTHDTVTLIESFFTTHDTVLLPYIKRHSILVYDEIEFTHFYDETKESKVVLQFLDTINADIFIPVYDQKKLTGYIIVERNARTQQLYSGIEQDQMIIYATYLGNIVNLLQNKNFDQLLTQQKNLENTLYEKHREITQYKESMKKFIRSSRHKKIGILFYKNRQFVCGNTEAKELIGININTHKGHPIAKTFLSIAQNATQYKSVQTTQIKDPDGNMLVISGVPHLDNNSIIITVARPDIADIIKPHMDFLENPTEWDYLLYLQTTESGKLINQLIPGIGPKLLNFKIDLLKTALSKKALLLDIPGDDLKNMVQLLHHINLRDTLHTLHMKGPASGIDIPVSLFGINPLFDTTKSNETSLLQKLDAIGTLFIKNVHFLDIETQNYLADFLQYGTYKIFKSEQKIPADVRIICSTNQDLRMLVNKGLFSKRLFEQLNKTKISLPELDNLSTEELHTLADGFSTQAMKHEEFKDLLSLSDKEKQKLTHIRPESLHELKERVEKLVLIKSKKAEIHQETTFDPEFSHSDPLLVEAARMGKQALKDRDIFEKLWNKLQSQNKIAKLLGVNRSSVYRRCKDYNLSE